MLEGRLSRRVTKVAPLLLILLVLLAVGMQGSSTWRLQQPLWIIEGQSSIGGREFAQTIERSIGSTGFLGGYPLVTGVEKYLREIRRSNTIFLIDASSAADLEGLQELEGKYPELLPLPYDELTYYPLPLVYFALDTSTNMVRGIIISRERVGSPLAELLLEEGVLLETPLRYEEGQLQQSERLETPWAEIRKWSTLESEYFIVAYHAGYENDAEKILDYAEFAREAVGAKFPYELDTQVTIYIYEEPTKYDHYYLDWGHATADYLKAEMYLLAPSEAIQVSSYYDDDWHLRNVIHEYTHIVVGRDIYFTTGKWMGDYLPRWLNEGLAEYFAIFCSTPSIRERDDPHLEELRELVREGYGYLLWVTPEVYFWSAYIVKYMYEVYGQDNIIKLIESDAPTFPRALEDELDLNAREFEDNWLKWSCEEFGADYDELYGY